MHVTDKRGSTEKRNEQTNEQDCQGVLEQKNDLSNRNFLTSFEVYLND